MDEEYFDINKYRNLGLNFSLYPNNYIVNKNPLNANKKDFKQKIYIKIVSN